MQQQTTNQNIIRSAMIGCATNKPTRNISAGTNGNRTNHLLMPLPSFSWANGADVWQYMLEKDSKYAKLRSDRMLERHPSLVDSYRSILFDWLSEVSHECKFHRETYHLALDFIDRYLSNQSNIGKFRLQLIGTTCLFLAAKYEEIRPPSAYEFADLTDGACKAEDIMRNEMEILSTINWQINPMTPNNWLNTYMQILVNLDKEDNNNSTTPTLVNHETENHPIVDENSHEKIEAQLASTKNDSFIMPTSNGILRYSHKRIASVIDLALLHIESLRFPSSILTASALYYFSSESTVRQCTGYRYNELAECIRWLVPFVDVVKDIEEQVFVASCKDDPNATQMHSHIATASLLDQVIAKIESSRQSLKRKACSLDEEIVTDSDADSVLTSSPSKPCTTVLLTPPSSTRKVRRTR